MADLSATFKILELADVIPVLEYDFNREQLREVRKAYKLSIMNFSYLINISEIHLCRIETGKVRISDRFRQQMMDWQELQQLREKVKEISHV